MLKGGYPALYDRALSPHDWFANYVATYVERDVRQILAVQDLSQFHRFVRMCAARSGQMLNLAALGADCGISAVTAGKWLSVLETSYLMFRLPPYHRNFGKRLVKTPKLYCLDVGLMAWLLGIRDLTTLQTHPARGALFETWVVSEFVKTRFNAGQDAALFFGATALGKRWMCCWRRPKVCRASRSNQAPRLHQTGRRPCTSGPHWPTRRPCRPASFLAATAATSARVVRSRAGANSR